MNIVYLYLFTHKSAVNSQFNTCSSCRTFFHLEVHCRTLKNILEARKEVGSSINLKKFSRIHYQACLSFNDENVTCLPIFMMWIEKAERNNSWSRITCWSIFTNFFHPIRKRWTVHSKKNIDNIPSTFQEYFWFVNISISYLENCDFSINIPWKYQKFTLIFRN